MSTSCCPRRGDDLGYEYDFGDGWGHRLVLQTIGDADERPAVCVDGARACPPEDCGGTGGCDRLLTLANPADPEFEYLREWSGGFESERFDVADANDRLLQ